MKKILCFLVFLIICGCSNNVSSKEENNNNNNIVESSTPIIEEDPYEDIYNKNGLISHVKSNGQQGKLYHNSQYYVEHRIVVNGGYYFAYVDELDLFKIAYSSNTDVVYFLFRYQNITNIYGSSGAIYSSNGSKEYVNISSIYMDNHELSSVNGYTSGRLFNLVSNSIDYANEYTTTHGYGYLTD